jgi:hypothetical protein
MPGTGPLDRAHAVVGWSRSANQEIIRWDHRNAPRAGAVTRGAAMPDGRVEAFGDLAQVGPCRVGDQDPGLDRVRTFLVRFGYLPRRAPRTPDLLDGELSTALRTYQERNAVPPTGEFVAATREAMTTARCALPDLDAGVAFSIRCAWDRRELTYAFDTGTADVAGTAEFQAVRDAFATWSAAVPLTFVEVAADEAPDVVVGWRPATDPDLGMVGGTLAHADFPPGCGVVTDALPKPVHFDDSEHVWSIGATPGAFDVETVALHEIGHILGLQHTTVNGAVMFPSVTSNSTLRVLQPDDLAGIRALYPG